MVVLWVFVVIGILCIARFGLGRIYRRGFSEDALSEWLYEHYWLYTTLSGITHEEADIVAGFRREIRRYARWHFLPCDKERFLLLCLEYFDVR